MSIASVRYEAHQPPLYYLLAALWGRVTEPILPLDLPHRLRLLSVLLGAGTVLLASAIWACIAPQNRALQLGAAAFVAVVPQHLAMMASVNNDSLSELLIATSGFLVFRWTRWSWGRSVLLGAMLGLSFLTKMQSSVALSIVGAALVYDTSRGRLTWKHAMGHGATMLVAAWFVALPWLARNVSLYGAGDPLGLARHDQVVAGQLTTAQFLQQQGWAALLSRFGRTVFQSFWGQFGWMGVVMHPRIYGVLALLSAISGLGLIAWTRAHGKMLLKTHSRALVIVLVWTSTTVLGFLWWNTRFLQHQGRYLFPALIPIGGGFTLGWLQALRRRTWGLPRLLLLGALAAALLGLLSGHLPRFTVALLLAATALVVFGRRLEAWQSGLAVAGLYAGLYVFALLCVPVYVIPYLSP